MITKATLLKLLPTQSGYIISLTKVIPAIHFVQYLFEEIRRLHRARANKDDANSRHVENPLKSFITMPQSKNRCRFDMFVKLKPQNVSRYPNNSLTWCHRGDKYTADENLMLSQLVKMLVKHRHGWKLAEIYDNCYPASNKNRIIVKFYNGIIETNRLYDYSGMLTKIYLPQWLNF